MSASFEFIEELVCNDQFCKYVLNPDMESVNYWNEFRRNNPDREEEIQEARQFVLLLGNENDANDHDTEKKTVQIWQKIQNSIGAHSDSKSSKRSRNELLIFSFKVAAVLLVMFLISFLVIDIQPHSGEKQISKTENYFQRVTKYGQKATFYLPDGSYVTLNAGSSLYYYVCNECQTRELILEGEAFFDVKRDTERPFIVKTNNLSATVLGTSFNVKAYPEEDKTEVALVTGKISVSGENSLPKVLVPNEMATYEHQSGTIVSGFDLEGITGWKDKILVFEDVSFKELTAKLSRWYGVEFIISDSARNVGKLINRKDYKGKYNNKSLETVLEAISFSYNFEYEVKDKKVWIR